MSAETQPRHRTSVRRQLIVDAAKPLFAENGLSATGAREIAAAAGISLGTLTYHFASTDDLLMEVLWSQTQAFEEGRKARVSVCAGSLEKVLTYLEAYLDDDLHPRSSWRIWLDCWARASHHESVRHWQVARYHQVYDELGALIARGIADGDFAPVDLHECAREFMAIVDGLGEQMVIDEEMTSERSCRILEGAVRRRLGGPI